MKTLFCLLILLYAVGLSYIHFNHVSKEPIAKVEDKSISIEKKKPLKKVEVKEKKKLKEDTNKTKKLSKNAVVIQLPKVPKVEATVPQVVTLGSTSYKSTEEKVLSMELPQVTPPKKEDNKKDTNQTQENKITDTGTNKYGRVSAYLRGKLTDTKTAKQKLEKAGFKVLASKDLNKDLSVIVFTNDELLKQAKKSPFTASLRLLVDKTNNQISITNPYYFEKAYLGDDFDEKSAKKTLGSLCLAFKDLKDSKDKLKYTLLPKYQFMFGMPEYNDMITVAKGDTKKLLQKAKNKLLFIQKISDKKYLLGINLWGETKNFYTNTGKQNSLLLPYPIMIEDGKAKILDPKYYIALSYPMLKMSQFMKISDIPSQIQNQCESIFK